MFPGLRKVTRKPGLAAKPGDGPSKKTGETKKSLNTKSLQQKCFDIPRLNLAKVRQNLDQKECLVASDSHFLSPSVKDESFNRVGLYTSPRFCPQGVKGDKRIFLSRRGTKESPLFNGLGATSSEAHINTTNVKKESSYEDVKSDFGGNNNSEKIVKYSYSDPMAPLLSSAVAAAGNLTTRRHNYESYSTKMWTNRELDSGLVHELENAKARVAKLQAKRLSLGLVTSLQDALAKVAKRDHHSMEEQKPLNSPKVTKEKLLGPLEGCLHQDASKNCVGIQHGNVENRVKEGEAEQVKLKPRKLLLDNNQSSIPLGFGGNPVDCVQTARASNTMHNVPVQSPRSALTERRMSRKDNLQTFLKRKKVDTPILTTLFGGAAATPEMVLKQCESHMSDYEKQEILPYKDVYFIGGKCQKIQAASTPGNCNFGFDDERGDYNVVEHDHLAYRHEVMGLLGKGSFGQVLKCKDHKTKLFRAVKIIRNKKRFHQQALVEVKILEHLRDKYILTSRAGFIVPLKSFLVFHMTQ